MRTILRLLIFSILLTFLSSCAYIYGDKSIIQNRETDYLKAKSVPPLIIPPGVSSSTIQASYPVSDRNYPTGTQKLDLTPPELNTSGN